MCIAEICIAHCTSELQIHSHIKMKIVYDSFQKKCYDWSSLHPCLSTASPGLQVNKVQVFILYYSSCYFVHEAQQIYQKTYKRICKLTISKIKTFPLLISSLQRFWSGKLCLKYFRQFAFYIHVLYFWCDVDNLGDQKSLRPLEKPLEFADYVVCPLKK